MTTGQAVDARLGWLLEQLDAAEATALGAIPSGGSGVWPWNCPHEDMEVVPPSHDMCAWLGGCDEEIDLHDDGGHSVGQAKHIAANDPARVLRTVAAHRAIVKSFQDNQHWWADASGSPYALDRATEDRYFGKLDALTEAARAIASIYSDVAGYDEHWGAK